MNKNIKKLSLSASLLALSIILGYVESLFPISIQGVGLKVGISNIVTLLAIHYLGGKRAFLIVFLRVIIVMMLFTNVMNGAFSMAGFLLSFFTMILCYLVIKMDNHIIISIYGGVMHNIGQVIVALIFIKEIRVLYLLPVYIIAGVIAGTIVGIISDLVIKHVGKIKF